MDRTREYGSESIFRFFIPLSSSPASAYPSPSHYRRIVVAYIYSSPGDVCGIRTLSTAYEYFSLSFSFFSTLLFSPHFQSLDPANDSWKNNSENERATTVEGWDLGARETERKKRLDLATQREEWHVGGGGRSGRVTCSRVQILPRGPLRPNWPSESISARPLSAKLRRYTCFSHSSTRSLLPFWRKKEAQDKSKWRENKSYRTVLTEKGSRAAFFFLSSFHLVSYENK